MPGTDLPGRVLARIFFVIWVAAIVLLVGSAIVYNLGVGAGVSPEAVSKVAENLVQTFLVLVPLGVLIFGVVMIIRKEWNLGLIALVLTLIWIGAKLLG